jgi:signal peptidase I
MTHLLQKLFKSTPKPEKKPREMTLFREYFEMIAEVLVYFYFLSTFLLQSMVIPTPSMEDNLLIGDHLFVDKAAYARSLGTWDGWMLPHVKVERGLIVTFKAPPEMDKDYVKRVIALPGETIRIADNRVYINGRLLNEPYTYFRGGASIRNFPPQNAYDWYEDYERSVIFPHQYRACVEESPAGKVFRVPAGHYFCMGDNRDNSLDCRYWGPLPADYIVGKPWRIWWSYQSSRDEYLTPGVFNKMLDIANTAVHFVTRTRWSRTVQKIK